MPARSPPKPLPEPKPEPEQAAASVRIRLLGPFVVERAGVALLDRIVGSRKGRTLLKLLVVDRGHMTPLDRIVEALWGDAPPARPERDVATLVSRLRAVVGAAAIQGGPDGYRFVVSDRVGVDLDQAETLTASAEARLASAEFAFARSAAERAVEILAAGPPLEDEPYAAWADRIRSDADATLRRARGVLWRAAAELGDHQTAVAAARDAAAADPFDEGAVRALMVGLNRSGRTGEGLAAYERLRAALADELGTDPSAETTALHVAILRGEAPASEAGQAVRPVARAVTHMPGAGDPGFVGRDDELATIAGAWSRATTGEPSFVAIVGEAGIGKTRLAREVVALAGGTGGTVLEGRCFEAERSLFLEPILDAIRAMLLRWSADTARRIAGEWAGSLAGLIPEAASLLGPPRTEHASPEIERRHAFEAVTGLLRAMAAVHPTMLLVDDLQNAGSSTMELLHFLSRRAGRSRLLVLATVRAEDAEEVFAQLPASTVRLNVGPLGDRAVAELASRMGAGELAERIFAMTRGHPLFVVETLLALSEGSVPSQAMPVPASLQSAVVARIGRAGRDVGDLLSVAATLGSAVDLQTVAALMDVPLEETARRVERASRARLLVESGDGDAFEFANDLIREIVYRTTPLPIRRARHRRAAALLEDPEAVASHATAAQDWPAAAAGWLRAAERAAERYSNRDAEDLLTRALDAAERAGDARLQAQAYLLRSRAREALADFQGAFDDSAAAAEPVRRTGDRRLEMQRLRRLGGDLTIGLGHPAADCVPYLEQGIAIAEELNDGLARVDMLSRLAVVSSNMLRFDLARERADEAVVLARGLDDERALMLALDGAKAAAAYSGDIPRLQEVLPELEALLRRRDDLFYLSWALLEASFVPMARGRWDDAMAKLDEALDANRRSGWISYRPMFEAHANWVERSRGAYGRALEIGLRTSAEATEHPHAWWTAFAETMLGWTLTELFDMKGAVAHLERGLDAAERNPTAGYLLRCLAHLAQAAALVGDTDRAVRMLDRADELFDTVSAPPGGAFLHGAHAYVSAADAWRMLGGPERAEALAGPILLAAEAFGWVEPAATAALAIGRCRSALHDSQGARPMLERALQVAESSALPAVAWQAHAELARVATTDGRAQDAEAHAASAAAIVRTLAASIRDAKVRRRYRDGATAAIARTAGTR